jgi:phosphatidylglycerol:prolipoprotein diacylglycerol transferase
LGHCLFYEPEYYLSKPWEIIKIWHGGLASHGAALGIFLALYLFARKMKIPMLNIYDRVAIVVALSGVFIRLGNFFNSEIYGIETTLPWGVIFVQSEQTVAKHPTQIYEALVALVLFIGLHKLFVSQYKRLPNGMIFGIFLVVLFSMRFFIEFIKEVQVDFESKMTLNMGQWLSIPLVILGAGLIAYLYHKNQGFFISESNTQKHK